MENKKKTFNRGSMLKIVAIATGITVGVGSAGKGFSNFRNSDTQISLSESRILMGTIINLTLIANNKEVAERVIQQTFDSMIQLVEIYDHRNENNHLYELNQTGGVDNPDARLVSLLKNAINYSEITNGAFDISVKPILDAYNSGSENIVSVLHLVNYRNINIEDNRIWFSNPKMEITLDGIAKGTVVDEGVLMLNKLGFDRVLVEAGGDLFASGLNKKDFRWNIGLMHPRPTSENTILGSVEVSNKAIATSGDYLNKFSSDYSLHHIIDPMVGLSNPDLSSATVIARTTTIADALGTAIVALGLEKGLALVESLNEIECLLVTKNLEIHKSTGFPNITY
jgi:FAD:protein FMN transferase